MKKLSCLLLLPFVLFFLASFSVAARKAENPPTFEQVLSKYQEAPPGAQGALTLPPSESAQLRVLDNYHEIQLKRQDNTVKEIVIISLLTIVSLLVVLFFLKSYASASSDTTPLYMVNATGLIFIVSGTIILTLAAETEQQLTAAIGILGAVAGYLFGSMRRPGTREKGRGTGSP